MWNFSKLVKVKEIIVEKEREEENIIHLPVRDVFDNSILYKIIMLLIE